jgi:hypothetical protein
MIAQRQTTNLIKRATAVWRERVLSWIDETPGVKTAYTTASAWQFLHLYPPCFRMLLEHSNARRLTQPEFQRTVTASHMVLPYLDAKVGETLLAHK